MQLIQLLLLFFSVQTATLASLDKGVGLVGSGAGEEEVGTIQAEDTITPSIHVAVCIRTPIRCSTESFYQLHAGVVWLKCNIRISHVY